jgi:beta-N-acetylhexosaminidase
MGALAGTIAERSRAAVVAGCDVVLHCNGDLAEMAEVAMATPELAGDALRRAEAALSARRTPDAFDVAAGRAEFARIVTTAQAAAS